MTHFKPLTSIEEAETIINTGKLVFIYITMPNCSVCHGLKPQIEAILTKYPNINAYTIDAHHVPEVAGRFQVFTAPVLLLFVQGKEYIREARIVQTKLFADKIVRIYENI